MSKLPQSLTKPVVGRRPAPPPSGPAAPVQWYRVTSEDKKIQRPQGDFILKRGKEINSADFDIVKLRNVGVELSPIGVPGWWMEAQRRGEEKRAELAERGIDVGDPVDPEIFAAPSPGIATASNT